ncbi:MAG: YggT family protein [Pseudomonadota bacterium]
MGLVIGKALVLALDIFFWIIIIQVVMSWLIAFNVVNIQNSQARRFIEILHKITDPVYKPLRKFIPSIGGIDITPIIIIFGISILKNIIVTTLIYPGL